MDIKSKIWVDKVIGWAIAQPLNLIVRLVGKILNIDHSLNGKFETIVVCKYKGMGSIIQSTPLLSTLRANYPEAKIVFVTSIENKAILNKIPVVDEILIVNDQGVFSLVLSVSKLLVCLWKRRVDLYIDLEIYSNFSSIITTLSLSRDRFGYYLRSNNYRLGLYTHMMYYNTKSPISQTYLQFARLLNLKNIVTNLLQITSESSAQEIYDIVKSRDYIVINPNASDLRLERRWGDENFVNVINTINSNYPDLKIVLIGSKGEADYVGKIYSAITQKSKVLNLAGKTSIDSLIGIIKYCRLLLTNDTGPMHIGFSLNIPVLALFGPCSPDQYGFSSNVTSIYKNIYCSPCVHEFIVPPCKGNNSCMKLITVEDVLIELEKILNFHPNPTSYPMKKDGILFFDENELRAFGKISR
jgi:ADP-heptose:LPS heptosyltransferase